MCQIIILSSIHLKKRRFWHILWEIAVNMKNFLRLGHLYYKGQTKSKCFFQANDSSKKWTNEFVYFCLTIPKTNLFVRFLEESEGTKKFFQNYLTFKRCCLYSNNFDFSFRMKFLFVDQCLASLEITDGSWIYRNVVTWEFIISSSFLKALTKGFSRLGMSPNNRDHKKGITLL